MNLRNTARAAVAMTLLGTFFGGTFAFSGAAAAPNLPLDAGRLLRAVERLSVVGNVLYVAAHPDDENTRLLGYLHGEKLLRTAYLSVTRGDGGQNLIGPEQGPLLGLIRTQELLAARRVDGAEQFFTRARDFGYSKTTDETLAIWGKDAVLADMVLIIRRFKPDVIITRFSTKGGDTHGHHTASAMLALEAFSAAADAKFHPEQLSLPGVSVWQAKRISWNRYAWGQRASDELAGLGLPQLDIGGYNAALGLSYGEIAADSRSMHKSQGFGSARSRGPQIEHFQPLLTDGKAAANGDGIFDGFNFSWARVKDGAKLAQLLKQARTEWNPSNPAAMIATLLAARGELSRLAENPWKAAKLVELDEVIAASAGLFAEANASEHAVAQGGSLKLSVAVINRSSAALRLKEVRVPGGELRPDRELANNVPFTADLSVKVPESAPISSPYWLAEAPEKGLYVVRDATLTGQPESPPALAAEFVFSVGASSETLTLRRPVTHKWTDPVAGERYRSLEITPAVMVNAESPVQMFPDAQPRPFRVRLTAGAAQVKGTVHLELPSGFTAEPNTLAFSIDKKGAEQELRFTLKPPVATPAQPLFGNLKVVAELEGKTGQKLSRGTLHIDYPHIPIQALFPEAEVKLCRFDLKKTRNKLAYIPGAGDDVPAALRQAGYDVTMLSDEVLADKTASLKQYAAIVVGVRAYNTNPRLAAHHPRLMEYVAGGGNMIVQYNTNNRLSQVQDAIGPYPFNISQERVTDENAAVKLDPPSHPVFARPNKLSDADFTGWVQERGLYFADKWNEKYEAPMSMHDAGEPERRGGLLVARHGKGAFIYTGLAFFRQLPAGVPGAYRLFANLIAYGQ